MTGQSRLGQLVTVLRVSSTSDSASGSPAKRRSDGCGVRGGDGRRRCSELPARDELVAGAR